MSFILLSIIIFLSWKLLDTNYIPQEYSYPTVSSWVVSSIPPVIVDYVEKGWIYMYTYEGAITAGILLLCYIYYILTKKVSIYV